MDKKRKDRKASKGMDNKTPDKNTAHKHSGHNGHSAPADHTDTNNKCKGGNMSTADAMALKNAKRTALRIAKDFCYTEEIIERIKNAKNEIQVENALIDGRHLSMA